jgi:hypothetical protein
MQSVIIPEETKKLLLEDAKDFMDSEEWYSQRGIPWQRGWLLYGLFSCEPYYRNRQASPTSLIRGSGERQNLHDPSPSWRVGSSHLCRITFQARSR